MPYNKGDKPGRKAAREETIREDDLEHELEPVARDVITSPISSASSYSSASGSASSAGSASSGATLSSEQLELILSANSRALADSMAANNKTMQASMTSLIASLTPAVPVAPSPSTVASSPKVKIDIPKWKEGDSPSEFLSKYEQALTHNGVGRGEWGRLLRVYLSDSGQAAYLLINPDRLDDYEFVKSELLESLGDTPDGADKRWVTLHRQRGESSRALFRRVHSTGYRRMEGLSSKEEVCNRMILSKFLTLLGPECYSSVVAKRPRNGNEAAKFAQEYEEEVQFVKALQPKSSGGYYNSYQKREYSNSNPGSGSKAGGSVAGSGSGSPKHSGGPPNVNSNGSMGEEPKFEKRVPTCYGCGVVGHIRPNCPNKVRRVLSPKPSNFLTVKGFIAGVPVKDLRVDPGADRTVVREEFIPSSAYTGGTIRLDSWRGSQVSEHQLAEVEIKVGEMSVLSEVAVVDTMDSPALLGSDLGRQMTEFLMSRVMESWADKTVEVASVRLIRAQVAEERALEEEDVLASTESESTPTLLSEVFDFPDSYFEVNVEVPMQIVNDEVPKQDVVRVTRAHAMKIAAEASDALVEPVSTSDEWSQVVNVKVVVPMHDEVGRVKVEVPMQMEPEVACDAPAVALEDIFCFSDSLFEPEVACDAPAVAPGDILCFSVSPFEPEEACDASVVALEDIFWPELDKVEFSLPDLGVEILEASVAPVVSENFVVPRQMDEVNDDVLEASVAPVNSDKLVVPMQQVDVKVDSVVACIAPADDVCVTSYFVDESLVEDQADDVASGPVDSSKPMVLLDGSDFVDCFSETDPVLAPLPVARPEPEKVVVGVTLAMEDSMPPKLCWQSPTVLVDSDLRFMYHYTKATGKFAPGSSAVIHFLVMSVLVISAICSFCSCISMCLSKLLVVLFFGDFGPRAVPLLLSLDDPPWRMSEAPSVPWMLDWLGCSLLPMRASLLSLLLRPSVNRKGGEMLWSLPPLLQQLPNIAMSNRHDQTVSIYVTNSTLLYFCYLNYHFSHLYVL